jgi:hypothetical protein
MAGLVQRLSRLIAIHQAHIDRHLVSPAHAHGLEPPRRRGSSTTSATDRIAYINLSRSRLAYPLSACRNLTHCYI